MASAPEEPVPEPVTHIQLDRALAVCLTVPM